MQSASQAASGEPETGRAIEHQHLGSDDLTATGAAEPQATHGAKSQSEDFALERSAARSEESVDYQAAIEEL